MIVYCNYEFCEFYEDGRCEADRIFLDEQGQCESVRTKVEEEEIINGE